MNIIGVIQGATWSLDYSSYGGFRLGLGPHTNSGILGIYRGPNNYHNLL